VNTPKYSFSSVLRPQNSIHNIAKPNIPLPTEKKIKKNIIYAHVNTRKVFTEIEQVKILINYN
jgi:hypothetical protein